MPTNAFIKENDVLSPQNSFVDNQNNQRMFYSRAATKKLDTYKEMYEKLERQLTELVGTTDAKESEKVGYSLVPGFNEEELLKKLEDRLWSRSPFVKLLQSLPPNFPVNLVYLNGVAIEVSRFVNVNTEDKVAHFSDDHTMQTFDVNKIEGIEWGMEE